MSGRLPTTVIKTPLGCMLAVATEGGLCALEFSDDEMLSSGFGDGIAASRNEHLSSIAHELEQYFHGRLRRFATKVELRGTSFQVAVWKRLLEIPYGETLSYGELADGIGFPDGARAVGRANGDNRLAIIVPCHRVIRADGSLCGYGGGLWRKKRLLELEKGVRSLV